MFSFYSRPGSHFEMQSEAKTKNPGLDRAGRAVQSATGFMRLHFVLCRLLDAGRRRVMPRAIASEYEVCLKTVHRDIEKLRKAGVQFAGSRVEGFSIVGGNCPLCSTALPVSR